jgi:endogenous inhibitor of DNA gyrase (YacG/DUF329 family)
MAKQCANCGIVVDNRQLAGSVHEMPPLRCPECDEYVIWGPVEATEA